MKKLSLAEQIVYIGANICSFGTLWILKIVIKKAIIESK